MNKKAVLEDEYVRIWFDEIEAEPRTIDNYSQAIYLFCKFTGKMPKELIEEAENEIRAGIPLRHRRIKRYLTEFANWVEEEFRKKHGREIAPKTLKDRLSGVRSFYQTFEIEVPRNKKKINNAEPLPENGEIPTIDMVKEALSVASVRDRAIVLSMLSSGMGDSEILSIKLGNFIRGRGYDPHLIGRSEESIRQWISEERKKVSEAIEKDNLEFGVTTLRATRKKTGVEFFTFLTPEATLAVLEYLEWRNRKPKLEFYRGKYMKAVMMEGYEKRKIRSINDYIFVRNAIPDEFLPLDVLKGFYAGTKAYKERYLKSKERREINGDHPYDERFRVLNRSGLTRVFRELAKKIGVDTDFEKWQILRGHGLRKLWTSLLLNNGMPIKDVEFMAGHKLPQQRNAYYRADEAEIKKHYIKHMNVLFTGRTKVKSITTEEFKAVEESLKAKDEEIAKLRKEIEEMKAREKAQEPVDRLIDLVIEKMMEDETIKKRLAEILK